MLNLALETIDRLLYKIPRRPKQVQIEITNRCNMVCPMCPREVMGIELEHMDWEKFRSVVDRLDTGEDITLTGWGEAFLHPRIFEMIRYCKERGHRVAITTNGLFPKPEMAGDIAASGVDALTFSVDGIPPDVAAGSASPRNKAGGGEAEWAGAGHNSGKVFDNIETVARLRCNGAPSLRLQATLHEGRENDLYGVIRYAAKLGVEVVNVGRIDRKYDKTLKRPSQEQEERIFREADALAVSLGVQLDWLQYSVASGVTRFFYRLLRKALHRGGRYCLKTFDYAYVNRNGDVTPCCLLPETRMGNLIESDIQTIWQSGEFNRFREHFRDTCGACDLWSVEMVDKS